MFLAQKMVEHMIDWAQIDEKEEDVRTAQFDNNYK